jgi:hypothetical protein
MKQLAGRHTVDVQRIAAIFAEEQIGPTTAFFRNSNMVIQEPFFRQGVGGQTARQDDVEHPAGVMW